MNRSRSSGYIRKKNRPKRRKERKIRSCCSLTLCSSKKKNFKPKKKDLTFTKQIFAPIVTLKDLISTSFSSSLSSSLSMPNNEKSIMAQKQAQKQSSVVMNESPQLSCKSLPFDPPIATISTPKSTLVHSYTSLSNYRINTKVYNHQISLEEEIHSEECNYCSNENSVQMKIDSNNNNFENLSLQSINLLHAIDMYLSNNSSHEACDLSSISSEQQATIHEAKSLSLCEINEIIYAINSDIENDDERNEILDSLASSLRQVAEETPLVITEQQTTAAAPTDNPEQAPGLGQMIARAVIYEIVMKLFSFYLLLIISYGRLF